MKKILLASFTLIAAATSSGCVALVAGAAGAGTVACTEKEIDCPLD
ncbi:hypothetical protein [Sphingosinithalassobacter portus]|nr:hypothetical protein [Sphingosinithalassobacter portus]